MTDGKRILVVDDEKDVVDMLVDVLAGAGYAVDAASDAEAALERIRENIYDAAILDFNLPDMDGVMLHRRIREMDGELGSRTLFMSGMMQSDTNLGYYAAQSAGFVPKPFGVEQLLSALREVLESGEQTEDGFGG